MLQIIKKNITDIKLNDSNPRYIKEDKFEKLVNSIKKFPEMLEIRPIVVDDDMVVLGGNMRLQAAQKAGLTEIPVIIADSLSEKQKQEFIIKDNSSFGEWDWDVLANEWDSTELDEWGLDVVKHDWDDLDFIEDDQQAPTVDKNSIVVVIPQELVGDKAQIEEGLKEYLSQNFSGCEVK